MPAIPGIENLAITPVASGRVSTPTGPGQAFGQLQITPKENEIIQSLNQIAPGLLASPLFGQMLSQIGIGSNQLREKVGANLARQGIQSGVGTLKQSAAQSASAFASAQARGRLLELAFKAAQGDVASQRQLEAAKIAAEAAGQGGFFDFLGDLAKGAASIVPGL